MQLTDDQIKEINDKCPCDQGIFSEPYGIPVHIKEKVIYGRFETGGYSGGSCWNDSEPTPYREEPPKDRFKVLDLVLQVLRPNTTFLEFRMISGLIHDNTETRYEYYGNSTDYMVEYIILSELYEALAKLDDN